MTHDKHDAGIEEIDCLEAIDSLYAWLDGELDDQNVLARFEAHLDHCRSCYSRAEMEKALSRCIREAGESEVPATLQHRLHELIDKL
jgi:anti-sigma factor (TIGR02949 family)